MSKLTNPQQLPPNEQHQFKNLVALYDKKQHTKALKTAEAILKKFPNHGETLAMKGLILSAQEKNKEAMEYARKGLLMNSTSYMVWHILGILYRIERAYWHAMKCFKMALYFDSDNLQILRDLAFCQVQVRDYDGLFATRRKLLRLRPDSRMNWIAFAVAAHLSGNPEIGYNALVALEEQVLDKKQRDEDFGPVEQSELELYKHQLLVDAGDLNAALAFLENSKSLILDKMAWLEAKGDTLLKLQKYAEAEQVYRELLEINPENRNYHVGLHKALQAYPGDNKPYSSLSAEQLDRLKALYKELQAKYPKSFMAKQYPLLHLLSGEEFQQAFAAYAMPQLTRGVPSLFNSVKLLYKDETKVQAIEDWMLQILKNLREHQKYQPTDEMREPPSTILWVLVYLAQHYSRRKQVETALKYIDEAIEHTPTVLDLYLVKARIYKHAGDPVTAAQFVEKARTMDYADRYLNTKSVKYHLRANDIEKAQANMSIFTKMEGDQYNNIYDMQVMWYEVEEGDAWFRKKEYGKALKKYTNVEKHFLDIIDDQHDFHGYCMRKVTLRTYIDLLRMEDQILGHKFYVRAAQAIVKTYLQIIDENYKVDPKQLESIPVPKKYWGNRLDYDPEGLRMAGTKDPLKRALRYVQNLLQYAPSNLQTQLLAAEVFLRSNRLLLALKAVKKAASLASADQPEVRASIEKLFAKVSEVEGSLSPIVAEVFKLEKKELLPTN